MTLTKTLNFEQHIVDIIATMEWTEQGGKFAGKMTCGQLDRKTYVAVNKALEAMGGKWDRKAQSYLFPTDPHPQVAGLLDNNTVTVAKDGYFPTPEPVALQMALLANLSRNHSVLEPSAGTGELADVILKAEPDCDVYVIEKDEQRAQVLKDKGHRVIGVDFFEHDSLWYRIIQNPPFEDFQDIAHVRHAYECLMPGGRLVSVMSEGTFFRNGPAAEFREWLDELGGYVVDLPADAFKSSGTGAKTRLVVIDKSPEPVDVVPVVEGAWMQLTMEVE